MMRLLLPLAITQIIVRAWLAGKMMGLQDEVERLSVSSTTTPLPPRPETRPDTPPPVTVQAAMPDARTVEEIRLVVREELEFALAGLEIPASTAPPPANRLGEEEALDNFYDTTNAIDAYAQQGRISPQDMTRLQQQIARLNPEHRTQAMRHLARTMNSGQLDARY